ncbi:DUF3179 domain-containing protein [Cytophagaceae bacterium AH-315-L13]|nr:DUF3179 domain-containing protein [Cytophagaceae bacterium AH-315-L13]
MSNSVSQAQEYYRNVDQKWATDTTIHDVPLFEFKVLLKRDGIPPIDDPKFWYKDRADSAFFEHEPVISIAIDGMAKAYPLSILMFHEIVNDSLNNVPITVTYCPLCNAAIVFDRRLSFKGIDYLFDFGVSGMLRNSDMIMWDRQTESWWQQFLGECLVGKLKGAQLTLLPSMLISYEEFTKSYPKGQILSTETGIDSDEEAPYGTNPYENYDDLANNQPRLFKGKVDDRLPAMERIININVNGTDIIYPLSIINKKGVINDNPHNYPVVIFFQSGVVSVMDKSEIKNSKDVGAVTVFSPGINGSTLTFIKTSEGFKDVQTQSLWSLTGKCIEGQHKGKQLTPIVHGNHFAFAWFAFKPECEIYGQDK